MEDMRKISGAREALTLKGESTAHEPRCCLQSFTHAREKTRERARETRDSKCGIGSARCMLEMAYSVERCPPAAECCGVQDANPIAGSGRGEAPGCLEERVQGEATRGEVW